MFADNGGKLKIPNECHFIDFRELSWLIHLYNQPVIDYCQQYNVLLLLT